MRILRKFASLILGLLLFSCAKDDGSTTIPDPDLREILTTIELEFIAEYEYVTFNFSPTSFGANRNEKWKSDITIFLDGEITNDYRASVADALEQYNVLFGNNGVRSRLVNSLADARIQLIFGEKTVIENVWPDMFDVIGNVNFQGYALYNRDQTFNITSGRIWVRNPSMPLFKHELGHLIGLGHASPAYCSGSFSANQSFNVLLFKRGFLRF